MLPEGASARSPFLRFRLIKAKSMLSLSAKVVALNSDKGRRLY